MVSKKNSLKLTDAVFDRRVEGVDDGGAAVGDPVGLVHWLSQFSEQVLRAEER